MSMNYYAVSCHGFLISETAAAYIIAAAAQKEARKNGENPSRLPEEVAKILKENISSIDPRYECKKGLPDWFSNWDNLAPEYAYDILDEENIEVFYTSNFDGEVYSLNGKESLSFYDDYIYYVPLEKEPDLFHTAYKDIQEIEDEIRAKLGEYLPEDFDYASHICGIFGTTFG